MMMCSPFFVVVCDPEKSPLRENALHHVAVRVELLVAPPAISSGARPLFYLYLFSFFSPPPWDEDEDDEPTSPPPEPPPFAPPFPPPPLPFSATIAARPSASFLHTARCPRSFQSTSWHSSLQ